MSFASFTLLNLAKVHNPCCQPSSALRPLLFLGNRRHNICAAQQQQQQQQQCGHTVRIIVTQDVSEGKLYQGDIANVSAGYARNLLIPKKMAVYATRQNFEKLQIKDPALETGEERRLRLEREAEAGDDKDLKAADLLRFYLRNKVVRFLRWFGWLADPWLVDCF